MVARDHARSRLLHIPLAAIGLLVLLGTVIAVVVTVTALIHTAISLLVGVPLEEAIETLSFTRVAADLTEDIFAWLAGILLFFISLPCFAKYNGWLGRMLYDRDRDAGPEL